MSQENIDRSVKAMTVLTAAHSKGSHLRATPVRQVDNAKQGNLKRVPRKYINRSVKGKSPKNANVRTSQSCQGIALDMNTSN